MAPPMLPICMMNLSLFQAVSRYKQFSCCEGKDQLLGTAGAVGVRRRGTSLRRLILTLPLRVKALV